MREKSGTRETGNHPLGRAIPSAGTLDKLGILPARFYRWYDRYQSGGYEALKDRPPRPKQVWNRIPDDVRGRVLRLALGAPELSPRELATRFIDTEGNFLSQKLRSTGCSRCCSARMFDADQHCNPLRKLDTEGSSELDA